MIKLTRLDGREFYLNCDLIEFFESTPDTVVTLRTEKKIIVKESVDTVMNKIISYKQTIYTNPFFQQGRKIMVKSDSPDLFLVDKNLKNMKNLKDIRYLDEEEDYDDSDYEEDEN